METQIFEDKHRTIVMSGKTENKVMLGFNVFYYVVQTRLFYLCASSSIKLPQAASAILARTLEFVLKCASAFPSRVKAMYGG